MLEAVPFKPVDADERAEMARYLRELADRYETGAVSELAIVGNDREENCFFQRGAFADRWRLLGAIEYAKATVLND